jgi:hypothetical protein
MIHSQARSTFKLNPINGITKTVRRALNFNESSVIDTKQIGSLLETLLKRLDSYPFALVRSNSFSLINISTVSSSFGYSKIEFLKNKRTSVNQVFFTFSVIPSPAKNIKQENSVDLIENDFMFGTNRSNINYLVVTLDQSEKRHGINYQMLKNLETLYNIVGVVTKSFVVNPRGWWESDIYVTNYQRVLYDRYYSRSPELLFKEDPIGFWIYSKHVWSDFPHLILTRLIDENFYKYFTLFILDTIYVNDELSYGTKDWMYGKTGSLVQYYISGIKKLLVMLNNTNEINSISELEDSVYCIIHLLYRYVEAEGINLDPKLPITLYNRLASYVGKQSDQYQVKDLFFKLFSGTERAAYDLLDKSFEFEKLAENLFGDLK